MFLALTIFYVTNVGTDVIFDIEQRRKINNLLNKDDTLIEEDDNLLKNDNLLKKDENILLNQVDNNHIHTSSTLYPTIHSF